jgi:hypothetical protein
MTPGVFAKEPHMKFSHSTRTAMLGAMLGVGCVLAQTAPKVTDTAPPPAEARESTGAVVLENSLVRAQRENQFQNSAAQTGVATVGRGATRAMTRAQTQAALAQAREAEALELYRRGAGSLTPK